MRVKEAVQGSGLPSVDAEVLLSSVLERGRSWLIAHCDDQLTQSAWTQFQSRVERRRRHEPVAYIVGEKEFYGRMFAVDQRVFIPRPSTEGLVRRALQVMNDHQNAIDEVDDGIVIIAKMVRLTRTPVRVVDVGTGSGCVAITLALERPDLQIIATDISADALYVARDNARRHSVTIDFREGDGLEPASDVREPFLFVSNPPYIPSGNCLMADVQDYEPHVALFGGTDGNAVVQELMHAAHEHPLCRGWVMECREDQW